MKTHVITVLVLASFFAFSRATHASPVSVKLTLSSESTANLFISGIAGVFSSSIPIQLEGTLDVDIDGWSYLRFDTVYHGTTAIALTGSNINLVDDSVSVNLGFLGVVDYGISNVGMNQFDSHGKIDLTNLVEVDPFEYSFDPGGGVGGTDIAIDQGLLTYNGTGPIGEILRSGAVDFASQPLHGTLGPVGQIGLVTQDLTLVGSTTTAEVIVSVPLPTIQGILTTVERVSTIDDTVTTYQYDLSVELTGSLVATGYYTAIVIPEPSTVVLLGIALVALIPLRWRFKSRQA